MCTRSELTATDNIHREGYILVSKQSVAGRIVKLVRALLHMPV